LKIYILHGSVATQLRCGVVGYLTISSSKNK